METLHEAIARLERDGFTAAFQAGTRGCFRIAGHTYRPEDLVVDEIVRFEGMSDPEDEAVLFALRTHDASVKGTFVASYGASMEPDAVAAMRRLETAAARTSS